MLPLPVLHGCTIGELAQMINGEGWMTTQAKTCPLTVIPVKGWKHGQPYVLPVKPSPNLPNAQSIRHFMPHFALLSNTCQCGTRNDLSFSGVRRT